MTDNRPKTDWRPLALVLATLLGAYGIFYAQMPLNGKAYALFPFTALWLYCGSRLSIRVAVPLTLGIVLLTDLYLFQRFRLQPNYLLYAVTGLNVLFGRFMLAHSQSWWRIGSGSVIAYAFFFLASNTGAWLEGAMPEYKVRNFETLMLAYRNGLEFLVRYQPAQLDCGMLLSFGVFGLHAVLAKAFFPAEQVLPTKEAI